MKFEISSIEIGKITEALSKAQGSIENALKDSKNPFYKSNYADLSSIMAATKIPLSQNNLSFSSSIVQDEGINLLICTLSHSSGEWFRSYMPLMMAKQDMQQLGAAISYARRFCLAALCHVGVEENDGEGCIDRKTGEVEKPKEVKYLDEARKKHIQGLIDKVKDKAFVQKLQTHLDVQSLLDIKLDDFEKTVKALNDKLVKESSDA